MVCLRRLKWLSGRPFADMYDAAPSPVNATQFLRIFNNDLVINCKRCCPLQPSALGHHMQSGSSLYMLQVAF